METLSKKECLKDPVEIGLDRNWSTKSQEFDLRVRSQGVYVIHMSEPSLVLYVGKTKGPMMDFATRLYRHATKSAFQDSRIYQALKRVKEETGSRILVSFVTKEQIRGLFKGTRLKNSGMIDIYEQVLIHILELQLQK